MDGLPGIDIVVERKTPHRVRQEWNKTGLKVVYFSRRGWLGNKT